MVGRLVRRHRRFVPLIVSEHGPLVQAGHKLILGRNRHSMEDWLALIQMGKPVR
jgi:hypothetical protein